MTPRRRAEPPSPDAAHPGAWETVIGLEIHVQLATRTKLFCADAYDYGAEPNTRVCPVCLGLPGALPVANQRAVELALRAALGLRCRLNQRSEFARKNYFYPDLPKGYQITQYDRPLADSGELQVRPYGTVRIQRLHLEEDSGKSDHDRVAGRTAIDFNRAGVPLIEIVTEPDLRSPAHARAFLVRLKRLLEYLEVGDCDMEKGSLRVDANVSVRPAGSHALGTKTEIKNLNSFAHTERALVFEVQRQVERRDAGGAVVHETLLWDDHVGRTRAMRSKEESHDYRYFPEPDLPTLVVTRSTIERARDALPEPPDARAARFRADYGLPAYDADVLTASRGLADYFEATATAAGDAKAASNRIMTDVLAWLNDHAATIDAFPVPPARLAEVITLVNDGTLSSSMGSTVLARMAATGRSAAEVVEAEGLVQVRDDATLERWVGEVLATHPDEAERLRAGEEMLVGFFMGQVMALSDGKADPERASRMLRERARGGSG